MAIMLKSSLFWVYVDVNGAIFLSAYFIIYNLLFPSLLIQWCISSSTLAIQRYYQFISAGKFWLTQKIRRNFAVVLHHLILYFNYIEYTLENIILLLLFLLRSYFFINRGSVSKCSINHEKSIFSYIKRHMFIRDEHLFILKILFMCMCTSCAFLQAIYMQVPEGVNRELQN